MIVTEAARLDMALMDVLPVCRSCGNFASPSASVCGECGEHLTPSNTTAQPGDILAGAQPGRADRSEGT